MVDDLSFTLGLKESLLITGHNGAGKSSIFRCLGGLWNIPCGTITKPGGGSKGLLSGVFYVPQKPYQVLGTLADQLTYPGSGSGEKVTKKMLKNRDLAAGEHSQVIVTLTVSLAALTLIVALTYTFYSSFEMRT